jgi:hypothetical protein
MMGRLLQVMPLLDDDDGGGEGLNSEYKVLVDTSNSFVYEVLVDIVGLKRSQVIYIQNTSSNTKKQTFIK